ncbi:hypothetical protein IFT48_04780 [Pseudomonas fluorescens]|uniref:hypothetical protein n=1 Tax=Pseudomonas TaxID=286 RepID=UPI000F011A39|nr:MULTISPECIES: hypothetical protein [Pseudomonas]MBD8089289.1 hypothetical protein [Pseudomonas fluorescens]MBD8615284.1 hypothetical protein [Pseudomonas putida]MBD8682062.1 hypothetical protein [Pseudomonas sp. CFBP 13719]
MKTFRQEMRELVHASIPSNEIVDRNIDITFKHFGWDGSGGCSMQSVGDEHLLTRERVRQISTKCARQMATRQESVVTTLPVLLATINRMAPARAERVEEALNGLGLDGDRLEGVLAAARQFNKAEKHLRISEEFSQRFVIFPDMEGSATQILAKARKITSKVGLANVKELLDLVPGIPEPSAIEYIRDVLAIRRDTTWLDEEKTWFWLSASPRNRLITCLHKMLSLFSSVTLEGVRQGANRYFKKGEKIPAQLTAPAPIIASFIRSWGQATCSEANIVRKAPGFSPKSKVLDYDRLIVQYIVKRPSKMAREKELENALVPTVDGVAHEKKHAFSIALNYSPMVCKGKNRGEYIANGAL